MRNNPHKAWYLGPNYLKNNSDGYLINPDTKDIYWYHGLNYSNESPIDIGSEKWSKTLYLSSSFETAEAFSVEGIDIDDSICLVYTVTIKLPTEHIFDVRKVIGNPKFKEFAYTMFGQKTYVMI